MHLQAITRMTEEVSWEHPGKSISVEFMPLDLASLQSVKRFTEDYKQKGLPLHILINNAGIASVPFGECHAGMMQLEIKCPLEITLYQMFIRCFNNLWLPSSVNTSTYSH